MLSLMNKQINQPTTTTSNPSIDEQFNGFSQWEEELRQKVRTEYYSELGQEQLKHLNHELLKLIEDFISGKEVNRFDLFHEWTKPVTEHWEIEFQTYFNDEYLKEVGLYKVALSARDEWTRLEKEYPNADDEHEMLKALKNHRMVS